VGKSTLFNALTKKSVPAENYPFCTIDPSVGIVPVPDERLQKLTAFAHSKKTIPAVIEFVDIAGLVKGASTGEGLGNKFLANIRETDAILHMVRIFEDSNVIHVEGGVGPIRDIEIINTELILADLETVTKRLGNLVREVKKGDKDAIVENGALERIKTMLDSGKSARLVDLTEKETPFIKQLNLLSMKPIIYGLNKKSGAKNIDETDLSGFKTLTDYIEAEHSQYVVIDAKIQEDLKDFSDEEKEMFKGELNDKNDGIDELIKKSYTLLNLMTYFTTGEDETRAWTIKVGSTAPIAGTAIHNDFKDKFIRAEVIEWDKLIAAGSYAEAKAKGILRTEGKEYIVKDGDVIEFKI
jgi:GTP-binding protein YchF